MHNNQADTTTLFFALVRCGIGKAHTLPITPTPRQWQELFDTSSKQTLIGITYAGIEALPPQQRPPKNLLLQWHLQCTTIKEENAKLNHRCAFISQKFHSLGFPCCILKGQGIAQYYPNPTLRTPGDIDIWLSGGHQRILKFIWQHNPHKKPTYHHIDVQLTKEVSIEAHFTPSWMYNPIKNHHLQKYISQQANQQFSNTTATPQGSFPSPTTAFNRVYILLHIYRHLFQEGIGLRQVLDYYHVISQPMNEQEKNNLVAQLHTLGLHKFASAVLYVMQKIFSLDKKHLFLTPDPKTGEFLLAEIMAAGNFGQHDSRYTIVPKENEFRHFLNSMQRITRLATKFPSESLWSPYFKVWHYFWRKLHHNKHSKPIKQN